MTNLLRLLNIKFTAARFGLDRVLYATPWFSRYRAMRFVNPFNWRRTHTPEVALRLALVALGPIFVKFGQLLSTRRDLLPDCYADELAKLQDQVPAFSSETAIKIIESSLGQRINDVFASFDEAPLASASVAQVHAAVLPNGDDVIMKVIRPNIHKTIKRDIALMKRIARLIERFSQNGRRLRPYDVVLEFEHTILDELDLMREAANAAQLKRNFKDSSLLHVPAVYWEHCRTQVMVMERIYGTPISHVETFKENNVNLKRLSENGVMIFFTQVFRDSFFHADMHPGNVFVSFENPDYPQYMAIDFGIMGTLNEADKRYLAENLLAFFNRDYKRVATLHVESGWVPADTRVESFEATIRSVCEPIFAKPLKDISFGQLLLRLFQTARRYNMQIQPQLMLLQKTLINIEGVGRELYPDLDLWETAKPFMENWIREQIGPRAILRKVREKIPVWAERLPEMPELIYTYLKEMDQPNRLAPPTAPVQNRFWHGVAAGVVLSVVAFGMWYYLM